MATNLSGNGDNVSHILKKPSYKDGLSKWHTSVYSCSKNEMATNTWIINGKKTLFSDGTAFQPLLWQL